jgi:dolichyl-phosphate-mannose--protein O-mannosyl transferase
MSVSRRSLNHPRHADHNASPATNTYPDGPDDHEPVNRIWQARSRVLPAIDWVSQSQWLKRALPVLVFVVALGLFIPRLDYPEKYLFDEILFAYTAGQYTEGNADAFHWDHPCSVFKSDSGCVEAYPEAQQVDRIGKYQWDHPPLGKHIISLGILVFGNDSFGWRISSSVFGAIGAVLAYHLGVKLSGRRAVGVMAAAFLLLDGLYFVYSRMGLVDIYVTVILLGAVLMFADYLLAPPDRVRWPMFATGVLLGLGIGTKWNAGYLAALVGLVVLGRLARLLYMHWRGNTSPEIRRGIAEHLVWVPLSLGIVPLAIYILAFTQFFLEGYSVGQFIELQKQTFHVHSTIRDGNTMASRWWEWPLALRHVWFGNRTFDDGRIATTYALGNPLLYWAFLPAVAWLCIRWWRTRNPGLIILLIGFFGQWLPWMFVERSTYTYHFLPAVPFGCLAVAMAVFHLYKGHADWQRTLAIEYVVLVALAFAFFYPIFSFLPINQETLALRMWLPTWR